MLVCSMLIGLVEDGKRLEAVKEEEERKISISFVDENICGLMKFQVIPLGTFLLHPFKNNMHTLLNITIS